METRNSKSIRKLTLLGIVTVFLASGLFFACKKDVKEAVFLKNNLDEIAGTLNGNKISGSLAGSNDENLLVLNYNKGSQFILIDKLPGSQNINLNSIQSAELVTSRYGIVIKDVSNNKILLLVNNDEESIKKFETIKSLLADSYESSRVFGITIVNSERS